MQNSNLPNTTEKTVLLPYYLRSDGEGHEFLVPVHLIEQFDHWVTLDTESDEFYDHPGFNEFMIGGYLGDTMLWVSSTDRDGEPNLPIIK